MRKTLRRRQLKPAFLPQDIIDGVLIQTDTNPGPGEYPWEKSQL